MIKCIKTGARIFVEEFNGVIACDLYLDNVDDASVIVVRYNPNGVGFHTEFNAKLRIGNRFVHDLGFIVCGLSDFDRDIRDFCYL
jgi:hypothetical protein